MEGVPFEAVRPRIAQHIGELTLTNIAMSVEIDNLRAEVSDLETRLEDLEVDDDEEEGIDERVGETGPVEEPGAEEGR